MRHYNGEFNEDGGDLELADRPRVDLTVEMAGACVPHAEKTREGTRSVMGKEGGHGGEDAYFIIKGPDGKVGMGVADGVYLWRWEGIDAGMYSRKLMSLAAEALRSGEAKTPCELLAHAFDGVTAEGIKVGRCKLLTHQVDPALGFKPRLVSTP